MGELDVLRARLMRRGLEDVRIEAEPGGYWISAYEPPTGEVLLFWCADEDVCNFGV